MREHKVFWTKDGKKIKRLEYGAETLETSGVASIFTTSLNETLRLFGANILELEAKANVSETIDRDEIKNIGLKLWRKGDNFLSLKYNSLIKRRGRLLHSTLGKWTIRELRGKIERFGIADASVSKLTIKFKDKDLAGEAIKWGFGEPYISKKDKDFIAFFIGEPCEAEKDKEKFWDYQINKDLLKQKFNYMVLNCNKMINERQLLVLPRIKATFKSRLKNFRQKYLIEWMPGDLDSTSPMEFAIKVKAHLGEYGGIKQYMSDRMDQLVLTRII